MYGNDAVFLGIRWSIVSEAFFRSVNTQIVDFLLSISLVIWSGLVWSAFEGP